MADQAGAGGKLMQRHLAILLLLLAIALPGTSATALAKTGKPASGSPPEALLNQAFDEIARQRLDTALGYIDELLRIRPNFRLAHMIKGDLLLARARPLAAVGDAPNAPADRIGDLREEALARVRAYRERPGADQIPRYLLQLRPDQKHAFVVDTGRSRLYVFENVGGRPRFVSDYYISQGKRGSQKLREGDQKTPIGVYHVTASLPKKKLSDFYGAGAFPINYPNEWDKRQGRNGHGIWLHGTPSDTFSRPPRSSDGCVVLSNQDLDALAKRLQIGLTPVIISEQIEWLRAADWDTERKRLLGVLERWRADWESRDTERYLAHYSKRFSANGQDLAAWSRHKRQVNAGKSWIKVTVDNVGLFRSPGKDEVVVVNFDQNYRSSNLSNVMRKRQYWLREGANWRIIHEGSA
ncbi:MAG: L,D-transpeptidase family protein [Betaproteobacteria bacterium]|nr:L,D-transpeptidase family protein [Betaproteobacteria bacterium]MBI2960607.1 L,D-transpeptidase family protein [Betaproteobacteria bacterium]